MSVFLYPLFLAKTPQALRTLLFASRSQTYVTSAKFHAATGTDASEGFSAPPQILRRMRKMLVAGSTTLEYYSNDVNTHLRNLQLVLYISNETWTCFRWIGIPGVIYPWDHEFLHSWDPGEDYGLPINVRQHGHTACVILVRHQSDIRLLTIMVPISLELWKEMFSLNILLYCSLHSKPYSSRIPSVYWKLNSRPWGSVVKLWVDTGRVNLLSSAQRTLWYNQVMNELRIVRPLTEREPTPILFVCSKMPVRQSFFFRIASSRKLSAIYR